MQEERLNERVDGEPLVRLSAVTLWLVVAIRLPLAMVCAVPYRIVTHQDEQTTAGRIMCSAYRRPG